LIAAVILDLTSRALVGCKAVSASDLVYGQILSGWSNSLTQATQPGDEPSTGASRRSIAAGSDRV
jgi:hypothetical protein